MSWSICPECGHNWVESLETPGYGVCPICGHDRNEVPEPEEPEYLSSCCSMPRMDDSDICSDCKEHATFVDEDGNEEPE